MRFGVTVTVGLGQVSSVCELRVSLYTLMGGLFNLLLVSLITFLIYCEHVSMLLYQPSLFSNAFPAYRPIWEGEQGN